MTKPQIILDRLSAWVEKQSSVGPAAFKGMREAIEREVAAEAARDAADSQMVYGPVLVDRHLLMDAASTLAACATTATNNTSARAVAAVATQLYKLLGSDVAFAVDESLPEDEATYRLRTVKTWLAAFPELREAITEHMATELQAKVTPLIESTMEEVVDKAFEMPAIDEAFEGLKVACAKFPEFKHRIQVWLADQPIEGVVEQLAKEMGEFARDEMGATASDVDEAIARDRARELVEP